MHVIEEVFYIIVLYIFLISILYCFLLCAAESGDYVDLATTLIFDAITSVGCVEVVTIEDSVYENRESFSVVLESTNPQVVTTSNSATVSLEDNSEGWYYIIVNVLCPVHVCGIYTLYDVVIYVYVIDLCLF